MSSSSKILPKIKALLEEKSDDGLNNLFYPVLQDIHTFADIPADIIVARKDAEEIRKLFANPEKPSLRELYGRHYLSFKLLYRSLHKSNLENLNQRQKREIDSFSEEFPVLLKDLINELDAMLKVDESTEHQAHYKALRAYLTKFTELIQDEEKKRDDELSNTSGGPSAS